MSELFPISSLGHSVVLPRLRGWDIHQDDDYFLGFLVATHLATALVLRAFFWRDWLRILRGFGRSVRARGIDRDGRDAFATEPRPIPSAPARARAAPPRAGADRR